MKSLTMTPLLFNQWLVTVPNGLTLLRPLGTILFVWLTLLPYPAGSFWARWGPFLIFLSIVGSDILDGWLARKLSQTSHLGRILDHSCDVLFILTALSTFVVRGFVPWWLPAAIAWAFLLYAVNVWWWPVDQPQFWLLSDQLGHIGGIIYYVTTGIVTLHVCTQERWLSTYLLWGWFIGLALFAAISGSQHLIQLGCRAFHAYRVAPMAGNPPQSGC
jgi:phosphatidylglycerophosphate synthase